MTTPIEMLDKLQDRLLAEQREKCSCKLSRKPCHECLIYADGMETLAQAIGFHPVGWYNYWPVGQIENIQLKKMEDNDWADVSTQKPVYLVYPNK